MTLAASLLAAAAVLPAVQSFWKADVAVGVHPTQVRIEAELVAEGRHIAVYRERGYRFSELGADDEQAQIAAAVAAFDERIYPRQVALFGPCPDLDRNGKVILLIAEMRRSPSLFFRFDQMGEEQALRFGFHSNQGEVLYHAFEQQGNRAWLNVASVAATLHQLLHHARDPQETFWAELVGNYTRFLCGVAPASTLWRDAAPASRGSGPEQPWSPRGWQLLFLEYVRERLGEEGIAEVVGSRRPGLEALAERADPDALRADFALACWLNDRGVGDGRFSFGSVTPPPPRPVAELDGSRPTSGQTAVGVAGMVHLLVHGDGARNLPLTLRGDPRVRWFARAVHLRDGGPDEEVQVAFNENGVARVDLARLKGGDSFLIAAVPSPADPHGLDDRVLGLHWGLGWVPQVAPDRTREAFLALLARALPDGGLAARARLTGTLLHLGGRPPEQGAAALNTRYTWAPEARKVEDALLDEATRRGLTARAAAFVRTTPAGAEQEWRNILIELPGADERRWPVVIAAHWDGARSRLDDSYLRGLSLDDNGSGVVVALEAAAALQRLRYRAPILVALLAGGHQGAAGAAALHQQMGGKIAAWIELEGVGVASPWPGHLGVRLEGASRDERIPARLAYILRRNGLAPRFFPFTPSTHTGTDLMAASGIPSVVIRTRTDEAAAAELDLPPDAERQVLSPELMVLLVKSIAEAAADLAGAP